MKLLKAYGLVFLLLAAAIAFAPFSALVLSPRFGIHPNWLWPAFCIGLGAIFSQLAGLKISITGGAPGATLQRILLGLLAGVALQFIFLASGMRHSFQYHTVGAIHLLFQIATAFAEEYLYRGAFQNYLAVHIGSAHSRIAQLVAAISIALVLALVHGLNPILFGYGGFDIKWFTTTLATGTVAGIVYGISQKVDAAFGVHLGESILSTLF